MDGYRSNCLESTYPKIKYCMKKALFVSSRELFPLIGGEKIRTAQSLKFLSNLYQVDVICESERKEYDLGFLKKHINKYYHFFVPKYKHYLWTTRFLFNHDPLQVNYYYSKEIQKKVDQIINEYDIVFCNNIRTTKYFLRHSKPVRYIDFVDSIAMNYERAKIESKGLKKIIYTIDASRCAKYEKYLYKLFNRCSVISEVDRDFILKHENKNNIDVIFNAVDIPILKEDIEEIPFSISFIGKMSYEPNITAVTNFTQNILPIIKKVYPKVLFYIVGANPTKEVCALQNDNVIVTGYVENINRYIQQSSIIVAPMLTGAGIQNKILQAMAMKRCVITSTIGAEGLSIKNNEISIVDGNRETAEIIIELLENKRERKLMGMRALEYMMQNFSNEKVFMTFKKFIETGTK